MAWRWVWQALHPLAQLPESAPLMGSVACRLHPVPTKRSCWAANLLLPSPVTIRLSAVHGTRQALQTLAQLPENAAPMAAAGLPAYIHAGNLCRPARTPRPATAPPAFAAQVQFVLLCFKWLVRTSPSLVFDLLPNIALSGSCYTSADGRSLCELLILLSQTKFPAGTEWCAQLQPLQVHSVPIFTRLLYWFLSGPCWIGFGEHA